MSDNYLLMIPGPTNVNPSALSIMSTPVISHRGPEFRKLYRDVIEGLKYVFQTENKVFLLTASGTGAVEFAVSNFIAPGEKVIIPITGVFSQRMAEAIDIRGANTIRIPCSLGYGINAKEMERKLDEHRDASVLALVFNETSTGVALWELREIIKLAKLRGLLTIVDSISALGGVDLPTDELGIDVHIAGSQKCIAGPPGLSFVAVSDEALNKGLKIKRGSFYFDLKRYLEFDERNETPFTPAVPLVQSLSISLDIIREEGLKRIFQRHKKLSEMMYIMLEKMGFEFVPSKDYRSRTVIAAYPPEGIKASEIIRRLREDYNIIIAGGMGELKDRIIRIGIMGRISKRDIVLTAECIREVMSRLQKHI